MRPRLFPLGWHHRIWQAFRCSCGHVVLLSRSVSLPPHNSLIWLGLGSAQDCNGNGFGQPQARPKNDHSRPGGQPFRSRTSQPLSKPNLQKTSSCSGSEAVQNRFAAIFTKKALAASCLAATGLVKIYGWPFPPKKSACGKLVSSNRPCKIRGWSFSLKKKRLRQDG